MKISSLTLFAAVVAGSFADAVPAHRHGADLKPRYYFPRVVKRQVTFDNSTTSTDSGLGSVLSSVGDALSGVASAISGDTSTSTPASTDAQPTGSGSNDGSAD